MGLQSDRSALAGLAFRAHNLGMKSALCCFLLTVLAPSGSRLPQTKPFVNSGKGHWQGSLQGRDDSNVFLPSSPK
jgi:hypothetical protein